MTAAKLIIEVVAGIIYNEPMPEYSKRWSLTHAQCENAAQWAQTNGEAVEYMRRLQIPQRLNWVRMEWLWL